MARLCIGALLFSVLAYLAGCTRRSLESASDGGVPDLLQRDANLPACERLSAADCRSDTRCEVTLGCCGGPSICVTRGSDIACVCPPPCSTLDERACKSANCVADYCTVCACTPQFIGCRAPNARATPCPEVECPAPVCDCQGFDEATCKAAAPTRGCTPVYCPDCNGGQLFAGCLGPNAGAPACPAVCPGTCRAQADCDFAQTCLAPGESAGCGVCFDAEPSCGGDENCETGSICVVPPCSCSGEPACVPGCQATIDCADGELCGADFRCRPRPCSSPTQCPAQHTCAPDASGSTVCLRRSCTGDGQCPGGFCVEGQCHTSLGTCAVPPP